MQECGTASWPGRLVPRDAVGGQAVPRGPAGSQVSSSGRPSRTTPLGDPLRGRPGSTAGHAMQNLRRLSRLRRLALVARFPRFLVRQPPVDAVWWNDWPVITATHLAEYPALADDFSLWIEELEPRFRRLDHTALFFQNQFLRQRVTLIAGGFLATSLGVVHTTLGRGVPWLAAVQAVLTGVLAGLTAIVRTRRAQQRYVSARLKADRIRSEFFLFLARVEGYSEHARETRLRLRVRQIEAEDG